MFTGLEVDDLGGQSCHLLLEVINHVPLVCGVGQEFVQLLLKVTASTLRKLELENVEFVLV